jgi:predicted glycoside hydrolase/deacetylase ChbG (UPF0249 family)
VTADRIRICKSRLVFRPLAPFINPPTVAEKSSAQFQLATPAPRFQGVLEPKKRKSASIELFAKSEAGFSATRYSKSRACHPGFIVVFSSQQSEMQFFTSRRTVDIGILCCPFDLNIDFLTEMITFI